MIDGGISSNNFIVQLLRRPLSKPVVNIGMADVSALGAAYLAGLQQKIYRSLQHLQQLHTDNRITYPSGNDKTAQMVRGLETSCYEPCLSVRSNVEDMLKRMIKQTN